MGMVKQTKPSRTTFFSVCYIAHWAAAQFPVELELHYDQKKYQIRLDEQDAPLINGERTTWKEMAFILKRPGMNDLFQQCFYAEEAASGLQPALLVLFKAAALCDIAAQNHTTVRLFLEMRGSQRFCLRFSRSKEGRPVYALVFLTYNQNGGIEPRAEKISEDELWQLLKMETAAFWKAVPEAEKNAPISYPPQQAAKIERDWLEKGSRSVSKGTFQTGKDSQPLPQPKIWGVAGGRRFVPKGS